MQSRESSSDGEFEIEFSGDEDEESSSSKLIVRSLFPSVDSNLETKQHVSSGAQDKLLDSYSVEFFEARIKLLEAEVAELKMRVDALEIKQPSKEEAMAPSNLKRIRKRKTNLTSSGFLQHSSLYSHQPNYSALFSEDEAEEEKEEYCNFCVIL